MPRNVYISSSLKSFIRFKMIEQTSGISKFYAELGLDEKFLNKLLNENKKLVCEETIFQIICQYLKIDVNKVLLRNLTFEKLRNRFFNSFFYCVDEEKNDLYNQVMKYSYLVSCSAYEIDVLIMDYIFTVTQGKNFFKMEALSTEIQKIYSTLSPYYQKMYSIFNLYYMIYSARYDHILDRYEDAQSIICKDKQLQGRLLYIGFSIFRGLGQIERAQECFINAKKIFVELNNISMLENLNIKYSSLLRSIGSLNEALDNDLNLLENYTIRQYKLRNIEILYNNIAWSYVLLHEYRSAIVYYMKALETLKDNEIYFSIAYCCYKIKLLHESKMYIELGKKSKCLNECFYLLLDWLHEMINENYSEKSFSILKNISKEYDLDEIVKNTIKIEIINYYYYNRMYEEAIHALQPLMGKQLISPSELIFTKKNENRHDFLFSEDEITLRSQMMELDDLFFEDDELGEDEWEELDDSFSRFIHN